VTVFEKADRVGGLLRYGIPDFKMEKHLINRRAVQMEAEGVTFKTSTEVGVDVSMKSLRENFDAVVLAGGAEDPRRCRSPAPSCPACAWRWSSSPSRTSASPATPRSAPRRAAR
jgi:glutamate synthase (NADPH/NADH) small chain